VKLAAHSWSIVIADHELGRAGIAPFGSGLVPGISDAVE
jgi:hypothetical protein